VVADDSAYYRIQVKSVRAHLTQLPASASYASPTSRTRRAGWRSLVAALADGRFAACRPWASAIQALPVWRTAGKPDTHHAIVRIRLVEERREFRLTCILADFNSEPVISKRQLINRNRLAVINSQKTTSNRLACRGQCCDWSMYRRY
jgi:hypothetical protein